MNGWEGERGQARLEERRVRDPRGYNVVGVPFPDEDFEGMQGPDSVITLLIDEWHAPMSTQFLVIRNVFEDRNHFAKFGYKSPEEQVKQTTQNRQNFLRAISIVAKAEDLPIVDISTNQHTEYDKSNQPFDFFQVIVTLGDGVYTRPGHTSKIYFYFSSKEPYLNNTNINNNNLELPILIPNEYVNLVNITREEYQQVAHIVDHMFQEYYKITEKSPYPKEKNVKNTARNIMRRRVERKVLEQAVGDPLFARYISQFGTTIPRRPINANLKKISPNLFKGGKTRRSASRKSKKTRKQKTARNR